MIQVKPYAHTQYEVEQSKYPHVGKLPTRAICLSPSGGGKTVLLTNLILNVYRNCFSRVYIISHSIFVDPVWESVRKYLRDVLKQDESSEEYLFDHYEEDKLQNIMTTQHKLIQHMKSNKMKKLFQICIILDDMIDDKKLCRNSRLLDQLYIRSRHDCISVITSVQYYHSIAPVIRVNATQLYVFKLRNQKDLDSIIEGLSALADKDTILQLYKTATSDPHSFLYIDLVSPDIEHMFYKNLNQRLVIKSAD